MKITESEFSQHIKKTEKLTLGELHFFKHIAVVEFNEGVHVDIHNISEIFKKLISYFGISEPFGLVANRVNSYSINLLDVGSFKEIMNNQCIYGVVSHNKASAMNAEIESNFCSRDNIHFKNIGDGLNFVYNKVKNKISISLN